MKLLVLSDPELLAGLVETLWATHLVNCAQTCCRAQWCSTEGIG